MSSLEKETLCLKEQRVLDILRNKNYSSINIIKNNGDIDIIEGLEKIRDNDRVLEILKQHDYQNIEVIRSNGKIVHINRTVRIKI